jgi:hypothetical protein
VAMPSLLDGSESCAIRTEHTQERLKVLEQLRAVLV